MIPGLQVKVEGHEWANLVAQPGALVVNVGDVLQIISNHRYRSVEHRVLANSFQEPRISVAIFFSPTAKDTDIYGPLPEIMSPDEPARYRNIYMLDLSQHFGKEVGAKSLITNAESMQIQSEEIGNRQVFNDNFIGAVDSSSPASIDLSGTALPFRTDASALGSYTPLVAAGSSKRRFSEMPVQPAFSQKEQN